MGKCPYCGAEVELKSAYEVYHTANSRDWGNLWVCSNYPRCDAYVGCHKNTDIPLGRLANSRLRELKHSKDYDLYLAMGGELNRREFCKHYKKGKNMLLEEYDTNE